MTKTAILRNFESGETMKRLFLSILLIATAAFAQPVYNALSPQSLNSGDVVTVWNAETPAAGSGGASASQQVALVIKSSRAGSPFSVDGIFSGAPGAFEIDVQVAAKDLDANYQTCSNCNITTVDATNQTFHLDAVQVNAKFVRLLLRSRANTVSITATVTGG